jgi:hypothetical protein
MRNWLVLVLFCAVGGAWAADFETDVLPILRQNCFKCHGNGKEKGDMSLDPEKIRAHIGSSGPIKPGDVAGSRIIELIAAETGDFMPPEGRRLDGEEIAILTEWVREGAKLGKGRPYVKVDESKVVSGTWTNTEGKEIVADLIGVQDGKALLRLPGGKVYPYPLEKLSEESRKRVEAAGF